MKLNLTSALLLGFAFCCSSSTYADTINAADLTNGTSSFSTADGLVTLTPFALDGSAGLIGRGEDTGGSPNNWFGILGDNDGAVDEVTTAGVVERERLEIALDPTAFLTGIDFRWTRSNGPLGTDGIELSGFTNDPMATVTAGTGITATYDSVLGSLFIDHPWNGGTISSLTFADSSASLGQTISLASNDSDQGDGQTAINAISYSAVPEPTAATYLALVGLIGFVRRRRK